ncbi:UNVERIFIED_ORG: PAS domain S-box-containing protein/diguanylate cyclase (GGDEF)-like protein [Idiomarina abyssalis]|uniref:EAL domain-containing protein n=1 Tax=Idiomarina sp. 28-8 TaxID=1260624 RepID=UPI000E2BE328|nr:EAL domain-containing protein [Idiomarina sp. 28-8]NWO02433.1 EAL domain-containing protein [Idiomarinaceae bacterium]TDO53172.1 PAS domain S-box-containing protein/diguanylate cyclase (GGDEF)-like protein [Idiomarina sp. 017G]
MNFTLPIRTLCSALFLCVLLSGSFSFHVYAQYSSTQNSVHQWTFNDGLPSNHVNVIAQGPEGFLWVATASGLTRFDGNEFKNILAIPEAKRHLLSDNIEQLFFDTSGALWLGTRNGLTQLQFSSEHKLKTFELSGRESGGQTRIRHISEDAKGRLLVGTDRFIYRHTPGTEVFEPLNLSYNGTPIQHVNYIYHGKKWNWLSTENQGVFAWDGFSSEVFAVNKQNPITDTIPGKQLYAAVHYQDKLWLATEQGLTLLDKDLRLKALPEYLSNLNKVNDIALTQDRSAILLSAANGLYELQNEKLIKLHNAPTASALQVTRGDVFFVPDNQGIYQLDTPFAPAALVSGSNTQQSSASINIPQLMQQVSAAIEDSNGNWWLATDLGLLFYNTVNEEISELNHYPDAQFEINKMRLFANQLYLVNNSGELYQYNIINRDWNSLIASELSATPNNLNLTAFDHSLWLHTKTEAIEIDAFGQVSQKKTISVDNELLNKPPHIDLEKVSNATFIADFTVPFAAAPTELHYRYKLNHAENSWQTLGKSGASLQLSSLPAGSHELEVQVSYHDDLWSPSAVAQLDVAIPFWKTPFAWIGGTLICALVLLSYWLYLRQRQTNMRRDLKQYHRQAQGVLSSRYQCWEWDLDSGELIRQNIWENCPAFPIDGKRLGLSGGKSNVHPEDLKRLQKSLADHLSGESELFECSYRLDNQGNWLWVLDRGKLQTNDEHRTMFGTLSDISSLISSEERITMLASSITNISDGICIFDRFFRKREVNNAFERISGFSREQVLGQLLTLECYPESFVNQIKRAVIKEGTWRGEITDVKANGEEFLMELTLDAVRDDNGEVSLIVASFSDITERRHTENELRRLSNTDTLTGLPNRSYFQVSHSNLVRKKVSHTLLLFDLDDFKKINDSLGHEIGDQLLCQVAERLMDIGRRQDTLYRLGGDEFGLLIEDSVDINLIGDLANQINLKVAEPYFIEQQEIVIGSSIGIVLYPHDGQTSQELLQKADMAMYHAKQRGGNCYQFFSQSMNENAVKRLKLENELRAALKSHNIRVYYQPKIEINSGHIAGLEALARIESEDGSMINPADFIPLAEETGLIIPLGEEVLRLACRDMKRFMACQGSPKSIAVNLSARQFMQSSLALQIEQILREEGLHPRHVEFEITEGMVMSDPERAITMMENLSDMGVKLALDDFGTGYSSLSYLKRFPMNSLKIDKAFVDDITINDKDRNMVASIIAMAHNLGLKVVAEGVETKAQLQTLKSLKCEYIQGFYFAKPMPADALIEFIEQHNEVAAQV